MHVFEAIETRRAVKQFDPEHRLSAAEERRLLELALLSPTALNIQHWRFVVVRDPALRQRIRDIAWNQGQVTDASLFIVLCADVKAWEKQPERYWRRADPAVRAWLVNAIDGYYRGREQVQRDETMRSCGIAAQTLMLTARALGYDSCPIGGFDFDAMARLIQLPPDHVVAMAVAIGKAREPAFERSGPLPLEEVVVSDSFG